MNVEILEKQNWIIFKTITGSHSYGTNIETSDTDYRGIFVVPLNRRVSILQPLTEVGQEKPIDVKYYEISKFFQLAKECNPNIIELLFMPKDCIQICNEQMERIIANRHIFISKRAYHTFSGYAYAQIKKAKGTNKWINNPKPKDSPNREDFCWIIDSENMVDSDIPFRPVPYKNQHKIDLKRCHVAALEHVPNTYRLYLYGNNAKGVFRNGNLVCESIPKEDEKTKFVGILIYNEHEYQKAMLDWKNYWTWMKERNPNRWVSQEKGEVDHDVKNMQHCIRLLMSGENILRTGEPIIRFEGDNLKYLRDIRNGLYSYDYLMADVDKRMAVIESLKDTCNLSWGVDDDKIDCLFRDIVME